MSNYQIPTLKHLRKLGLNFFPFIKETLTLNWVSNSTYQIRLLKVVVVSIFGMILWLYGYIQYSYLIVLFYLVESDRFHQFYE